MGIGAPIWGQGQNEVAMSERVACVACAEEILKQARLCMHCGTLQDDPRFATVKSPEAPVAPSQQIDDPQSSMVKCLGCSRYFDSAQVDDCPYCDTGTKSDPMADFSLPQIDKSVGLKFLGVILLLVAAGWAIFQMPLTRSESWNQGYSDARVWADAGSGTAVLIGSGNCSALASLVKDFGQINNFNNSDYIAGCREGYKSIGLSEPNGD